MNINELFQKFIKEQKTYFLIYFIFIFVYPVASVFLPKYYGQAVEDLKNGKNPKFILILFLLLITNVMYMILDKLDSIIIPKLQVYIRVNIVKAIINNYKDKFQEQELGNLISIIVKLPLTIRELFWQIRSFIIPLLLILPTVILRFMFIDKRIGIICLTGIFAGITILTPILKNCIQVSYEMDNQTDSIHENISEIFDNLLDIYSSNTHESEINILNQKQNDILKHYQVTSSNIAIVRKFINGISIIVFFGIIIYSYQLYQRKEIDITSTVNILLTSMFAINKIGSFSGELPEIILNMGTYIRAQKYMEKLHNSEQMNEYEIKNGEIIYKNVVIKYGDKQVIKDFNLIIKPRESIAIIGKIGSGKSSLIKALLRLIPYEGHIYIDGNDISQIDTNSIRSQIMYVRQNPIPFNRTLYENIVYGNEKISKEQVKDMFSKYDLHSFFDHDLDKKVGKKGDKLSGGQRQMIFLLRVLLSNNPIIILDEPNSSLDEKSSKYVMRLLKDILEKRTVILITHDNQLGKIANRKIEIA